ncbi:MAG: hypothetical protein NTW74_02855, partial [Acidobacteria bacterium]|nr:hypothetical protein [Acidobacteriota bacterium]
HAQTFDIDGAAHGWDAVLRSLGQVPAESGKGQTIWLSGKESPQTAQALLDSGAQIILEGFSPLTSHFGVAATDVTVSIRQIRDIASPDLPIVWESEESVLRSQPSDAWQVRAKERWNGAPVLAIRRFARGSILWTATPIGQAGYERYPFLPQALLAAGLKGKVRGTGLWAFFDAGFRQRADLSYLVDQWKLAGIGAIHVTSWQFDGADQARAEWLAKLIALCHESLIQVYAWVELPHVSERFWTDHPECRERTASGMEASLDWRRLTNLVNPVCSSLAETSVMSLLRSFDWDGVNLGELYFESLEGHQNPARFTPFNDDVRAEYRQLHGRDPLEDLKGEGLATLLEYRANLAARLQADWLSRLETIRREKPGFDIVLTHIDDRFDTRMRDALGADAARLLRGTEGQGTGFLIEDPATVWHLGPSRYREIRKRYAGLTQEPERLSIDLNIVDRYQDVYPTRRQTGAELAQLVHEASANFNQVALYFEYSLRPVDLPILGLAAARVASWQQNDGVVDVKLTGPARLRWPGAARVNGILWPLTDGESLMLPEGQWHIEGASEMPSTRIRDLNVRLEALSQDDGGYTLHFDSRSNGTILVESALGVERVAVGRGKGSYRISVKPLAAGAASSSAQLLHQR